MKLPFDILSQNYVKPKLYLCETNKERMCQLETISLSGSFKFNAYSELEFSIGRTYTNMVTGETQVNPFYNKIEALRLVYLEGFGYFEIQEPEIVSDGIKEIKNVTAYSLEYRLSQKYLENFKINTGEADSLEVVEANGSRIIPIRLVYDADPNLSLTDLTLEKIYDWTWGHIDDSLKTMSRQFDISRASVYDFIVQDICEKFNCYAVFDTINNKINLYAEALISKYIGDGKSNTFIVSPPYKAVGTVSIDSYKTTKYTYNPETGYLTFIDTPANGARIEVTDGSQEKWQTDVYVSFENLAQEVNISYSAEDIKTVLTVKGEDNLDIREVNMGLPYIVDLSYYYTVDWMGQDLYDAYTKYLQTNNLAQSKYSNNAKEMLEITGRITYETQRLSLQYSIADNVTSTTVGTYYVRGGAAPDYYYREVKLPDEYNAQVEHYYMLSGSDLDEDKFSKLYAALQTYFVSGEVEEITELKESFEFMETNTLDGLVDVLSNATTLSEKDDAILMFFDGLFDQLGRTPLESLYLTPYKKIESTNKEAGWSDTSNDNYWRYYPVTLVIKAIEKDIEDRKTVISAYQKQYNDLQTENNDIAKSTSIYNNFTHDQLIRLSPFLREDEYTDDNFVETDSDTIEILMQTKQELLECGKIELAKLCEPKLAFSMDMANIFALIEFEPIIDQFQLGNLINVVIRPDYIKKARLLAVDINFDDFSDFSCEFGELTSLRTPSSIHADLLANALSAGNSVASGQSYWDKGADLATSTDIKIQNGLLGAIDGIYNNDKSVLIDNHGILLRQVLDNGEYSPYQIWLTNNNILVSTDGFDTAQTGIGVFEVNGRELYGVLAKAVLAGYIEGSDIVGGTININDTFMVDMYGNVTMRAASIEGYVEKDNVISSINQSPEQIAIDANKISLTGKQINLTSDNISIDSTNFSVTKDGRITATSGEIAGWSIEDYALRKELTCNGTDYQIYLQAPDGSSTLNAFAVRRKDSDSSNWDVQLLIDYTGRLAARNAYIEGDIIANSLHLGDGVAVPYSRISGAPDLNVYIAKDGTIGDEPSIGGTGFKVSNDGLLTASNAVIYGTVYANAGAIAGYNIGPGGSYSNAIYKRVAGESAGTNYEVGLKATSGSTDLAFYVKKSTNNWASSENVFYIHNSGKLYAQNAEITGKINASSGSIGGFHITDNYLYSDARLYATKYQTIIQASNGSDTTTAFAVRYSTDEGQTWTEQFKVNYDGSAVMRNAEITGSSRINAACIENLSAEYITAGVLNADRIPNISADKITTGTLDASRLSSSVITTGNFSSKSLSTGNLTIRSGCTLGATTYNATINNRDGYVYIAAAGPTSYGTTVHEIVKQAVLNGSSRDIKDEIHDFDDRYDVFFDNLKPQLYKYNFEQDEGYSMGYIWQEANEARENANLTKNDVGAIYESAAVTGGLGLRKVDFIALNTWQIQKLKARIEELEKRLEE